MGSNKRYENIDLLRLIAMFFVVCVHYVGWGGLASAPESSMVNRIIGGGIAVSGNICVNLFYMISGYFIKENEDLKRCFKKSINVWKTTVFYSVLIPFLLIVFGQIQLSLKSCIMLFFPFLSNQYWFATCYIVMTLFLPFISCMVRELDKKSLTILVILLLGIDCIQSVLGYNAFSNNGYGLLHALTMYMLGYWIKKTEFKMNMLFSVFGYILSIASVGGIVFLSMMSGDRNKTIADYNSIFIVIASMMFFLAFLNVKLNTTFFGGISPYVFGVYLLNDNQYARNVLWKTILKCDMYYNSKWFIIHFAVAVIGFMFVALLIEFFRIKFFKKVQSLLKYLSKKEYINEENTHNRC